MNRRLAHHVLMLAVIAPPLVPLPAGAAGLPICLLSLGTAEGSAVRLEGLRKHGHVDGTHIAIESRFANNQFDRLPKLVRVPIGLPVDVLVTFVTLPMIAAKTNTKTIPIVMVGGSNPVASGLVAGPSRFCGILPTGFSRCS